MGRKQTRGPLVAGMGGKQTLARWLLNPISEELNNGWEVERPASRLENVALHIGHPPAA